MKRIAITGATGFVGARLLDTGVAQGHAVNALTRRDQPDKEGVAWIAGSLEDEASLAALVTGCDAVIHVAGAISAPDRTGFAAANIAGTERMIAAAETAAVKRFIHVSSLAAREPEVSDYGWSKAEAEKRVERSGLDWTIIRPPAVYGPGDRETLELFRMAARGLVILPPRGRLSIIHVDDLCALLLACIDAPESLGGLYEPDDGTHNGLTHRQFAQALGRAVDHKVRTISMPRWAVKAGARFDRLRRGNEAKLTADRARYFCHPDWTANPVRAVPAGIWTPRIPTDPGLADTARWYREQGWLR